MSFLLSRASRVFAGGVRSSSQRARFSSRRGAVPLVGKLGDPAREVMEFDLLVVGGGPAGLAAAIRAKQVDSSLSVCLIEKGAEIGAHILSGNVFQPTALSELLPDWKERGAPLRTPVKEDHFHFLMSERSSVELPHVLLPPVLHNEGNYIISLGELCRWMGSIAEEMEVEVYPGFSGAAPVFDEFNRLRGVQTSDMGLDKDGERKEGAFEPGMQLLAKQTILAEGCRGSLSEDIMAKYGLRDAAGASPQVFGLGLKEVWEVDASKIGDRFNEGRVEHTVGFPLSHSVYGGGFVYHMGPNLVHLGMVVGLDYKNPWLSPYGEFQRWKTHPLLSSLLEGGQCISYGARCLNEGGFQALPKLSFPGGMLTGCSAGFLNVPKIKGTHLAMKSGMLAGECAAQAIGGGIGQGDVLTSYEAAVEGSWIWSELESVRNVKPAFKAGLLPGLAYSGAALWLTGGKEPWTFRWSTADCDSTSPSAGQEKLEYPKPDNKLTFDLLDNLARANVNHEHDQPAHLKVKEGMESFPEISSLGTFGGPESRFCPAKVYEYVPASGEDTSNMQLRINAQNCVHCKCCSIKTPKEYIRWTVPEGGGGPQYGAM